MTEGVNLASKAGIEKSFRALRDSGYTTIYWRMAFEGHPMQDIYSFEITYRTQLSRVAKEFENTPYAWDPHEIRWPVEVAHKLGMKFYAWIVPYNEGAPPGTFANAERRALIPGVREFSVHQPLDGGLDQPPPRFPYWRAARASSVTGVAYETEFSWQSKFVSEHPEFQLVDRQGKNYHYGVLEWAYPEARQYWLKDVQLILDKYDVDGIYMDTRTECMSPEFADQFGFNEPIVKEFQRRHGVNILVEDFDLEQWRALRGEYFTLFLKEMAELIHSKGKRFSLGTSRGDYIGFPLGNMKLEWRKWISGRIVDELHLDEHGWGWGRQGYGYVTDWVTGRGLKPLDAAVREDYGPACRKYGTKLYFVCKTPRARPVSNECCRGRATPGTVKLVPDWCDRMVAMPEFDGIIAEPKIVLETVRKP
jgi:hypothetical protein